MKPSVNKMQQEAREAVHERRIKELEAKLCKTQQELSVQHNHNAELQSRISELEAGLAQSQREVAALRLISTVPQQDKPPRRPACVPGLCEIVSCSCRDGIVEAGAQEAALPDPATLVLSTSVDWSETIWQPFAVAAYAKAHTALKAIPSLPAGLSLPEMPQLKFDSIEAAKESLLLSAARLERTMSMLPAHISPKPWHAFPSVVTWTISVKVKVSQQVLWAHLSEVRAALLTSVEVMQCLSTDVAEMYSVRNLSDSVETISEQWGILPAPCSRRSAWHACPSVVTWATNLKSRVPRNVEDGRANTALHTLFEDTSIALASIRRDFLAKKKSSDPASPILNAIPPVDISLPPIASIGVPLPHMPALGSWPGVDSQDEGRQNTGSMVQPPTQSSSAERRSGPSPAAVTLDALVDGKEHTIAGLGWENRGAAVLSPVPFQSPSIIADDFTEMSSARTQYEHAGAKTGASAPTALESDDLLSQLAEGLITTEEMRKLASTFTPRTCQAVLEQERCLNAPNTTSRSEDMRPQILEEVSTGQWNNRPGPSGTGSARIVPYSSDTLSSDNDSRPTSARLLAAAAEAGEGIRAFLTAITPREMSAQEKEEAAAAAAARREARQRHKEKQKALELEAAAKKKMLADKKAGEKRRQEEEAKQAALQQAAARKDAQRKAIEAERRRREDAQQRKKAARDRARNHEQDGIKEKATVTKNEHSKVEQSRKSGSAQSKPQEDWEQQRPPACSPEPGAAPARDCARALDDAAQTAQKQAIEAKQRAAEVDDAGAWRETEVSRHDSAVARMAGARRQRIVASAWLAWVDEAAGGLSNECEEKMLPLLLKGSTDGQIRRHFSLVDSNLSCIQVSFCRSYRLFVCRVITRCLQTWTPLFRCVDFDRNMHSKFPPPSAPPQPNACSRSAKSARCPEHVYTCTYMHTHIYPSIFYHMLTCLQNMRTECRVAERAPDSPLVDGQGTSGTRLHRNVARGRAAITDSNTLSRGCQGPEQAGCDPRTCDSTLICNAVPPEERAALVTAAQPLLC